MEAVRATLEAYAAGKIKLGKIPAKTNASVICIAPSVIACGGNAEKSIFTVKEYTRMQVAEFLGWMSDDKKGKIQPDFKCKVAFHCLEAVERGLAKPTDFDLID